MAADESVAVEIDLSALPSLAQELEKEDLSTDDEDDADLKQLAKEESEEESLRRVAAQLNALTVRPESEAAALCRKLAAVVSCTFLQPEDAVGLVAMCNLFPERKQVTQSAFAKRLKLEPKKASAILKNLKANGCLCEVTKQKHQKATGTRYATASYYVDFQCLILGTVWRLHSILEGLNQRAEESQRSEDAFVCENEECSEHWVPVSTMSLMSSSMATVFRCDVCDEVMQHSKKVFSLEQIDKKKFNAEMAPIRTLLKRVQTAVNSERRVMEMEAKKAAEELQRREQGMGDGEYKAVAIDLSKESTKRETPFHLRKLLVRRELNQQSDLRSRRKAQVAKTVATASEPTDLVKWIQKMQLVSREEVDARRKAALKEHRKAHKLRRKLQTKFATVRGKKHSLETLLKNPKFQRQMTSTEFEHFSQTVSLLGISTDYRGYFSVDFIYPLS